MLKDVELERQQKLKRNEIADASNTLAASNLIGRYAVPTFNQVCIVTCEGDISLENRNCRIYPLSSSQTHKQISEISPLRDSPFYSLMERVV